MPPARTSRRKPRRTKISSSSSTQPATTPPEIKIESNVLNDPPIIRTAPQLPNEIIERILSNLTTYDQGTLASCCAVSRTFNAIAHPMLWRWIRLSPHTQPKGNADKKTTPIDISSWSEEDCNNARFLSLPVHSNDWCNFKRPRHLDLPNIEILEIELAGRLPRQLSLHQHAVATSPLTICPLAKHLLPRSLIIRNAHFGIKSHHMRDISAKVWSKVEDLVFIFSYSPKDIFWFRGSSRLQMPHLSRIFWIFDPIAQHSSDVIFKYRYLKYLMHQ